MEEVWNRLQKNLSVESYIPGQYVIYIYILKS